MARRVAVIVFLSISAGIGFGFAIFQNDVKSEFLKRYSASNLKTNSIQSDFKQEQHLEIMEKPIISTGKFYYKKPDLMLWDQLAPSPYYLRINGDEVVKFDGTKEKTLSSNNPQVSYFKNFIMGTVDGSLFESGQFESEYIKSAGKFEVHLNPVEKQLKKRIDRVELTFSEEELILQTLAIHQTDGDKLILTFSNQELNSISDNTIFN